MNIRLARRRDAAAIAAIYNHYIERTVATFEEVAVDAAEMAKRVDGVLHSHGWYAAEDDGDVVGYAYAGPWQSRCAYRQTVETTVYVSKHCLGRGIGRSLYRVLLENLRAQEFHCAIAGIALPNEASVALHEKLGFVQVAEFKQVGYKFGRWLDVGYWQLMLEPQE